MNVSVLYIPTSVSISSTLIIKNPFTLRDLDGWDLMCLTFSRRVFSVVCVLFRRDLDSCGFENEIDLTIYNKRCYILTWWLSSLPVLDEGSCVFIYATTVKLMVNTARHQTYTNIGHLF